MQTLSAASAAAAEALLSSQPAIQAAYGSLQRAQHNPQLHRAEVESVARLLVRACRCEPHLGQVFIGMQLPEVLLEAMATPAALPCLAALTTMLRTVASTAAAASFLPFLARSVGQRGLEGLVAILANTLTAIQTLPIVAAGNPQSPAQRAEQAFMVKKACLAAGAMSALFDALVVAGGGAAKGLSGLLPDTTLSALRSILATDIAALSCTTPGSPPALLATEGLPVPSGLADGPFALTATLFKLQLSRCVSIGLAAGLSDALAALSKGPIEASPAGITSLLSALHYLSSVPEGRDVAALIVGRRSSILGTLVDILHPNFLAAIDTFKAIGANKDHVPKSTFGIAINAKKSDLVAESAVGALLTGLTSTQHQMQQGDEDPLITLLRERPVVVYSLVQRLKSCSAAELAMVLALLSRFVVADDAAAAGYVRAGGMQPDVMKRLFDPRNPASVLATGLTIISQLARSATTAEQQQMFAESGLVPLSPPLLRHPDASVRARAANLLGNLCRHSDRLYSDLLKFRVLPPLIDLCTDKDRSARKFACFAIGNAGFHNASLYEELRPAVPALVVLLKDEEDRTRANAAGALGNLLRNSSLLVPAVEESGALQALLNLVKTGVSSGRAVPSSVQIALFSMGNMCAHKQCAEALLGLDVKAVVDLVLEKCKDATAVKYATRVRSKLQVHESSSSS